MLVLARFIRFMMATFCCLRVIDRRRKKRLYGASCGKARAVLEELSAVPLQDMCDPDAVLCSVCETKLCSVCETKLNRYSTLEAQLQKLKQTILELVSIFHGTTSPFAS